MVGWGGFDGELSLAACSIVGCIFGKWGMGDGGWEVGSECELSFCLLVNGIDYDF